ncbi:MAG TPA: hypothetical protein V6C52_07770 [Coleofasciculaceae cyanobacterium]
MLNFTNGISIHTTDSSPDKRKPATEGRSGQLSPMANNAVQSGVASSRGLSGAPLANTSAQQSQEQFRPQMQQANAPNVPVAGAGLAQAMMGNMQQIAAQVATYFKGNTREARSDKKDEQEKLQREQNDELLQGLMGDAKVEQSHGAGFGGGGR